MVCLPSPAPAYPSVHSDPRPPLLVPLHALRERQAVPLGERAHGGEADGGQERRRAAAGEELSVDRPGDQAAQGRRAPRSRSRGSARRDGARARPPRRLPRARSGAALPSTSRTRPRRSCPPRTAAPSAARSTVSTSAPFALDRCARFARPALRSESTAHARPVSPALIASAAIRAGRCSRRSSTRSPSLMPVIATVSGSLVSFFQPGHACGGRALADRDASARAGPSGRDDIVRCCEKSGKNSQNASRETGCPAGRPGRRQHDDDRRRARHSQGPREADRLADADGHRPPRQAHRRPLAADQGFRAARRRSTTSCSAAGTSSKTDCYEAAKTAGVLEPSLLEQIRPELEADQADGRRCSISAT